MSDLLHIGERLGSLTTQFQQHSERLDSVERDVRWLKLAARVILAVGLWLSSLGASTNSATLGKHLAPILKQVLGILLKSS
jgi:hypothetical protein